MPRLDDALLEVVERLVPLHERLCPRQVLGARIGLYGGRLLDLQLPQSLGQKRLMSFVETDVCLSMASPKPLAAALATERCGS
jgi:formylmethanofuran dehydrogenase subunit E